MVNKNYLILLLFSVIYQETKSQNIFFDEINFTDNYRNLQLLNDSSKIIENSFLIRSTSSFQAIQDNFQKNNKKIIKNIHYTYDYQNNSLLPESFNDGLMYPSRGWQERKSIGVNIQISFIDVNFQPEKLIVQNLTQEPYLGNKTDGNFIYKYFGMVANNIDNFRQFGFQKIDTTSPGQSRIGIKFNKLSFGFSSENMWWGPGKRNSFILTNNPGGFKHYYLKTANPIKTNIGNFEFSAISGILDTTKFFEIDQDLLYECIQCKVFKNLDKRNFDAFTINWQPKILPNFYIGYAYSRQYYANSKNEYQQNYSFYSKDIVQQKLGSMMFRFLFPKDHAEFYGELGLSNEAAYPWKFFAKSTIPGYIFGANKFFLINKNKSFFNLSIEFTQLQIMDPRLIFYKEYPWVGGKASSIYLDTKIKQGYSNNGQLIGASIGPGSNSQSIFISWNKGFNKLGINAERVVHNNDFYSTAYITPYFGQYVSSVGQLIYGYYNRYWVDLTYKLIIQTMPIKNILISASFSNTNAMNYRWIRYEDGSKYDEPSNLTDKFNQQFQFSIKYLLHAVIK